VIFSSPSPIDVGAVNAKTRCRLWQTYEEQVAFPVERSERATRGMPRPHEKLVRVVESGGGW